MTGDEETVIIPVNKLPPEFIKKHLEFNPAATKPPKQLNKDAITKKAAAVEVVKQMEMLKVVSTIALAALWISLFAGFVFEGLNIVIVLLGTGIISFFFVKSEQGKNYLINEYLGKIYREQHATTL